MKYVLAAFLLLMTALVQASVMPAFPVFGVVPNLVLAHGRLLDGRARAAAKRWSSSRWPGLCLGLVGSQPLGVALLATMPIVLFAELRALRLTPSDLLLTVAIVFLSSMVYEMVLLVALRLQRRDGRLARRLPARRPADGA